MLCYLFLLPQYMVAYLIVKGLSHCMPSVKQREWQLLSFLPLCSKTLGVFFGNRLPGP